MSPAALASARPVTVWATSQLAGVKVSDETDTVPSAASPEATAMVTPAVGWLVRDTANVAVPPASVVTRPVVGVTAMPATSLSALTSRTSGASRPSYRGSRLTAGEVTMWYTTSPSATKSSTPVTVTACGTFQLSGVKVRREIDGVPS